MSRERRKQTGAAGARLESRTSVTVNAHRAASAVPGSLGVSVGVLAVGLLVLSGGVWRYWLRPVPEPSAPDEPSSAPPFVVSFLRPPIPEDISTLEPVLANRILAQVQAVRDRPDDPDAYGQLGILYEAHGYSALAMECYRHASEADRSDPRWKHHWAVSAQEAGDAEAAEEAFRDVITQEPRYAPAHFRLALLLLERNAYEEAADAFRQVIQLRPNEAPGYVGSARVQLAMGRYQEAVDLLSKALEIAPDSDEAHYLLGRAYRRLGRLNEAKAELAHSGRVAPAFVKDPWREAVEEARVTRWRRHEHAKDLMAQGQAAEAAKELEELLADYPDHTGVMNDLAAAYRRLQRPDEAVRLLNRALEVKSDDPLTHVNLAAILADQGNLSEALEHAEQATLLAPKDTRGFLAKGKLSLRLGRYEEALASFHQALRLKPPAGARLESRTSGPAKSRTSHEIHGLIGLTFVQLRRWDEAADAYEKAVELNPQSVNDRYRLGLLYSQTGRLHEALATFRAALELDPDNERIRQSLKRIEARLAGN